MDVIDSTKDVVVLKKKNYPRALGALYFIVPGQNDSSVLVFHNMHEKYPGENDTVNLGNFPNNTKLTFMYLLIDTCAYFAQSKNKKVYTGQNRDNVDTYLSEMNGPRGKRWAIVGSFGSGICEVGFSAMRAGNYSDLRFHVINVNIVK